ncbi:hypothetical protein SALBM311S_00794 [Streptomyces alboniger]
MKSWRDRVTANRAVAYRIHHDTVRGRWYVTASWQRAAAPVLPLDAALARGVVGVDMNDDHLACWHLDVHGNPVGEPQRYFYDLTGTAQHRDAQIRHALTRLLHHTRRSGAAAIAIEDLDFREGTSREKHGRNKRFRRLISRFPTAKLKARLVSMAAEQDIAIVAVDPAYTSRWGAHALARKPLTTPRRRPSRHNERPDRGGATRSRRPRSRRRTTPPPQHRSDGAGHRTVQAQPDARVRCRIASTPLTRAGRNAMALESSRRAVTRQVDPPGWPLPAAIRPGRGPVPHGSPPRYDRATPEPEDHQRRVVHQHLHPLPDQPAPGRADSHR